MYPLILGFSLYSLAFFFGIFEEIAFYYYYLMVLASGVLRLFFGTTEYYRGFELSGGRKNNKVGVHIV